MQSPLPSFPQRLRAHVREWLLRWWAPLARTRAGLFLTDTALALRAVARGFQGEDIHLRAAALTYISVFSLVPLLTVVLALLGTFHQEGFQRRLRAFVFAVLAPGVREESASFLERFLDPANATTIGGVGFLGLLFSAVSLLRNIDGSLNDIWGVRRQRPLWMRLLVYAGLLFLGPLVLALSFVGTGAVRSVLTDMGLPWISSLFGLMSPGTVVGSLTLLYHLAPNTHVRFRSSLAGGLVAGLGWGLARVVYTEAAAYSFRYPLYGSLGALPLFLVWLYVGWLIILSGARFSYSVEMASFRDSLWGFGGHPRARELVAARLAQEATLAWLDGAPPPVPRELAKRLRVPEPLVLEVVDDLTEAGLLEHLRQDGLRPARSPAELTLADLTLAVHGVYNPLEPSSWRPPEAPGFEQIAAFFITADHSGLEVLRRTRWMDLAALQRPELMAPAEPTPGLASGN